jgi:hypothetical protein
MAVSDHDIAEAAAMLANALIANTGSRQQATARAVKGVAKQTDATGKVLWRKVTDLLRSPDPIPPHRGHFPEIPNPNDVRYERVQCFASGGAVNSSKVSKETANYSPYGSEERHCSICTMFREPHSCTEVQGDISRTAICDYFEPIKKRSHA